MNLQKNYFPAKHAGTRTKSDSSTYSTCSSDGIRGNFKKQYFTETSRQNNLEGSFLPNETTYSISPLDQNLDVLTDEDIYLDCNSSKSDSNNSTEYIPLEAISKLTNAKSNISNNSPQNVSNGSNLECNSISPIEKNTEKERLVTILEETEITCTKNSLISDGEENTGMEIVQVIDGIKNCKKISTKRVLFVNEDNVDKENRNVAKLKKKTPKPIIGKSCCSRKERNTDENSNDHQNTTQSFVMWEKYCEASDTFNSRKSLSFSELNSVENYDGDNEFSASYKSFDDTYVSRCSIEFSESNPSNRSSMRRSKSCDSLLREVRHLPHILYDKFLKCLAEEIENMRKQKIYCNCHKSIKTQRNEENIQNTFKRNIKPSIKILSGDQRKGSTYSTTKAISPSVISCKTKSPRMLTDSQNNTKLSPISPKTVTRSWNGKQIVSPVGEYIRGKRPSPYKNLPSKSVKI